MRTIPASLLAVGSLLVLASPRSASADTVPFAKVPVVPAAPKATTSPTAPTTIPATEHVEGVFVSLQPEKTRKRTEDTDGYHYVGIFTSQKAAQAYATDGSYHVSYDDDAPGSRSCLSFGDDDSLEQRLTTTFRTKPYVPRPPSPSEIKWLAAHHRWPPPPPKPAPAGPPKDTVYPLHLEKVTVSGDTATIDMTDAFLDLKTLGARLASSASTKLTRIATGPSGVSVFAARDDAGHVQFLVTAPQIPQPQNPADRERQLEGLSDNANRLQAQLPDGGRRRANGCGHLRFSMGVKAGLGQMATIFATAFLPPSTDPDDSSDGEGFNSDSVDPEQLGAIQQALAQRAQRMQRARPVAIDLSLSQLASEQSPLLSVTMGWAGKDERFSF
jgi:hypothetical protein